MSGVALEPLNKKQKRYTLSFHAFGKADAGSGTKKLLEQESLNCDYCDGVLSSGFGMEYYKKGGARVPALTDAERFFIVDVSKTDIATPATALFCMTKYGELYLFNEKTRMYDYQLGPSPAARMACVENDVGDKYLVVSSPHKYFVREGAGWTSRRLDGATGAMCVCKDRIFLAMDNGTIAYSDPYFPHLFDGMREDGTIQLAYELGEIVAMLCFKNQVYVFHQFGVASIKVTGNAETFEIQPLDYRGGEIFGDSVGVCGNVVFFLAADGVYRFDGKDFHRVEGVGKIAPSLRERVCQYSVCGNTYLLQYEDIEEEWRAVAIAADGKSGYFTSVREGLSFAGGMALCQLGNYVVMLRENGEIPAAWKPSFITQRTDFGVVGRKTLRTVRVRGRGLVTMRVGTDRLEKEYALSFDHGVASVDLRVLGENFYFAFSLGKNACVQEVAVDFSVAKGG